MKKSFLLIALAIVSVACTIDEDLGAVKGNPDDVVFRPEEPAEGVMAEINTQVFELLDLDRPELKTVRMFVEAGEIYNAAYALREYYRMRSDVSNPLVNLLSATYSDADFNMAESATKDKKYRFYVRNYWEKDEGGFGETTEGKKQYYSFNNDGVIDWTTNPKNVNDAQEWRYQKHRLQWMEPQARVYYVTKDEKYAEAWVDIFGQWVAANGALEYEDGTNVLKNVGEDGVTVVYNTIRKPGFPDELESPWTGLQTSERLRALLNCFFYYINSETFTPQFLTNVLASVYDHVENMRANPWSDEKSNIRLSQDQSLFLASVFMPEFKKSAEWLTESVDRISAQLEGQFNEDGVQNELDLSYHIGVIADFISIYKVSRDNDLIGRFPADYVTKLHGAASLVQDMMYSNYTLENFNDTRSGDGKKSTLIKNLAEYHTMFPEDGEFLYMSTERVSGKAPSTDLRVYPESGFYSFRTGWNDSDMVMVLKNHYAEGNKPWHSQADNGHFGIYKNGRRFTPDAGVPSYGGTSETNGYRNGHAATRVHNTMNVGGTDIPSDRVKGKYLKSGADGDIEYLVFENPSYNNLTHRRAVFFVDKKFFVLVDEGYGDAAVNDVELCFNLCESANVELDKEDGQLKVVGAHTKFGDNNNMLFRTFAETDAKELVTTTGYYCNDIIDDDYKNKRIQRRVYRVVTDKPEGKAARMITVIHPFSAPADWSKVNVTAEFTDNKANEPGTFNPNGATVTVTVGGTPYVLSYSL